MQKASSNKKRNTFFDRTWKTVFKGCLLFVFGLAFFLQHPEFSSLLKSTVNKTATQYGIQTKRNAEGMYYSDQLPFQSAPAEMGFEMELAEEEDSQNSQDEFCSNLTQKYASDELAYTCFLRSRYLQLASSVQKQPLVPFFILYHSWKQDLKESTRS